MIHTSNAGKRSEKEIKILDEHTDIESEITTTDPSSKMMLSLCAVTDGEILPIETVEDEVFSQKMIGEGFAMKPTSYTVVAPISGKLIEVADAKHAYYIEADFGLKVLIHVGLDTLLLNGEGFSTNLKKGMTIKKGETLVVFDEKLFKEKGYKTTIPVVVLDDESRKVELTLHPTNEAKAGTTIALTISF